MMRDVPSLRTEQACSTASYNPPQACIQHQQSVIMPLHLHPCRCPLQMIVLTMPLHTPVARPASC